MRKITYWVCRILTDSPTYNIRAKTKTEAQRLRVLDGVERYEAPEKHTIEFADTFDLVKRCLGEGRGLE